MSKYYFVSLMFFLLLTASAWAYYEDFEDPDNVQATLSTGQTVKGICSEALGEGESYRVYHGDDTSGIFLGVGEGVLDPKDQGIPKQEVFVNPKRRVVYS